MTSATLRSCVRGVGAALAGPDRDQRRTLQDARHVRRVDHPALRDPATLHRGGGRDDVDARDPRGRRGASSRGPRALRHRPHRRRDLDPGLHVPRRRYAGPGQSRHRRGGGLRPAGGLHRVRLRRDGGRQVPSLGLSQAGARDRGRDLFAHSRLEGSDHLRPVRRRRRRDRAGGAGKRRRPDVAGRDRVAPAGGRSPSRQALRRRRPFDDHDGRATSGWKARRSSVTRSAW